jgi:pimeloyl-ACP methyl ester carboxylesterase
MTTVDTRTITTNESSGQIAWHVEQSGKGADIVLIPSGEGDCGSFANVAASLAKDFRVTTFDTPGFSRSTISGEVEISMIALAPQVARLLEVLSIEGATVFGCSSAGLAVLDLVVDFPGAIRQAVVHEAALPGGGEDNPLRKLVEMDDAGVTAACAGLFANLMNENPALWQALGEEFHKRLSHNYPTWIRRYVSGPKHALIEPAALSGKPITWTIGGLFEARMFFSNVQLAHRAGLDIGLLPCKHFPQVSIPQLLAEHIRNAALKK